MVSPDDVSSCQLCSCSLSSSVSLTCDKISGQCICKSGLTGRICDIIEDFHWLPFLEGLIYEAEFASLSVNYVSIVLLTMFNLEL